MAISAPAHCRSGARRGVQGATLTHQLGMAFALFLARGAQRVGRQRAREALSSTATARAFASPGAEQLARTIC
jgi:hypothetical protein